MIRRVRSFRVRDMSLSARLSVFVAMIVFGVVMGASDRALASYARHVDRDLTDAAGLGAETVADELAQRRAPLDPQDVRDTLHDLVRPIRCSMRSRSFETDSAGRSARVHQHLDRRAGRGPRSRRPAIARGRPPTPANDTVVMFARARARAGGLAVAVTVGLESLFQARTHGLASRWGSPCRPFCW